MAAHELHRAFPEPLWADAGVAANLIDRHLKPADLAADQAAFHRIEVRVDGWPVSLPYRLYDRRDGASGLMSLPDGWDLTARQRTMAFCLLSRHTDGFRREAAFQRIVGCPEAFVVPFVSQLASEYVKSILMGIWLHLPELDRRVYGAFFRDNPDHLTRLRQRMISYWNGYYREPVRGQPIERPRGLGQDAYIGFEIFDAFARMMEAA